MKEDRGSEGIGRYFITRPTLKKTRNNNVEQLAGRMRKKRRRERVILGNIVRRECSWRYCASTATTREEERSMRGKRKRTRVSRKGKGLGGDERNRLRGAKV